jgi:hypothetical protein
MNTEVKFAHNKDALKLQEVVEISVEEVSEINKHKIRKQV